MKDDLADTISGTKPGLVTVLLVIGFVAFLAATAAFHRLTWAEAGWMLAHVAIVTVLMWLVVRCFVAPNNRWGSLIRPSRDLGWRKALAAGSGVLAVQLGLVLAGVPPSPFVSGVVCIYVVALVQLVFLLRTQRPRPDAI